MTLAHPFRLKRLGSQDITARVTGSERGVADLAAEGMLHGRILVSPHAHALIRNIDTSKARGLPGVVAVLTHADCTTPAKSACSGLNRAAPLFTSQARFAGDWIAAVAAETELIAEAALHLIEIDCETLPAVDEDGPDNLTDTVPHSLSLNDGEAAFTHAARSVTFEGVVSRPLRLDFGQQTAFADLDADGGVTVTSAANGTVPERSLETVAALLARTCARPVKVVEPDVSEAFSRQASASHSVRISANEDGGITAVHHDVVVDMGAYSEEEVARPDSSAVAGAVYVGSLSGGVSAIYTHTPPIDSAAKLDNLQSGFIFEQAADMLAEALDIDPLTFRLRNLVAGDAGVRMSASLRAGAERFGWQKKWRGWSRDHAKDGRYRQGIGLSILSRHSGGRLFGHQADFVEVEVDIETGFTVLLSHVCALDITQLSSRPDPIQLQASVVRSIGNALIENFVRGGAGIAAAAAPFRAPTIMDAPDFDYVFTGTPLSDAADGAHDSTQVAAADLVPAMANAIYDATGIRMTTLPFSADKILWSLNAQAWRHEPKGE